MIIPDTIEPYIGYKALRIDPEGLLVSPTYQVGWPPGTRMEATCGHQGWDWILVAGTPPPRYERVRGSIQHGGHDPRYYQTTGFNPSPAHVFFPQHQPKPDLEAPDGFYWDYQMVSHIAADPDCSCGIYAVQTIGQTAGYLDPEDCVLCEITMWGQVTIGEHGARGQYAYPSKLYVPANLKEKAITVAATYEVEWVPQTFTLGRRHVGNVPLRNDQDDARVASTVFLALSATLMAIASLLNLLTEMRITPSILVAFSLVSLMIGLIAFYDACKTTA